MGLIDPKSDVLFHNTATMTVSGFICELKKVFDSFLDFNVNYESIMEVEPGIYILKHGIFSGTHTGKPYGYGPFPEVEAKGLKAQNDPESLTFWIEDCKIVKMKVFSHGNLCGPPGFYEQVGGFPQ